MWSRQRRLVAGRGDRSRSLLEVVPRPGVATAAGSGGFLTPEESATLKNVAGKDDPRQGAGDWYAADTGGAVYIDDVLSGSCTRPIGCPRFPRWPTPGRATGSRLVRVPADEPSEGNWLSNRGLPGNASTGRGSGATSKWARWHGIGRGHLRRRPERSRMGEVPGSSEELSRSGLRSPSTPPT